MWGDVALVTLGLTREQWWAAVEKCRWFAFDLPGKAGWQLTTLGKAEAL